MVSAETPRVISVDYIDNGRLCNLVVEGRFSEAAVLAHDVLTLLYRGSPSAWKIEEARWTRSAPYIVWGRFTIEAGITRPL